jgi:hypothetical protein
LLTTLNGTPPVEIHAALYKRQKTFTPETVGTALEQLYAKVDDPEARADPATDAARYYKAALQATNDRSSRATRGDIVRKLLDTLGDTLGAQLQLPE